MSHRHSLRRDVGAFALMLTGLGSIIGSGWLFGPWKAAQISGIGSLFAWIIGAIIISAIALSYTELGAMFPRSGGMVRYGHLSHGSLLGFIAGWANWIAIVSVIPVEAEASVQYMSSWSWSWAHSLSFNNELSHAGLWLAACLVLFYFVLNFWGIKLFVRSNTLIATFKLIVPALTGIALIASGFHHENFAMTLGPHQNIIDWSSVLTTVSTAGIVFSFNGFQSPINLAGEAHQPDRTIPFAVMGSIALATLIYLLLQVAYIGAVSPAALAQFGWKGINFRSPFAELALMLNLNWLAILLYMDAFVSPSGTGITYTATTARMLFGMERNGTLPPIFGRLHPHWGVPRPAMCFNLIVSYLFLFFFRGWSTLAAVISVATIISYLTGPVSAMSLRRTAPHFDRPLRVWGLPLVSASAFIFATELLYWSRWPFSGQILVLIVVALPVYVYGQLRQKWAGFRQDFRGALWMIVYLPAIACLSWAGSAEFGGHNYIPYGIDLVVVALAGLLFYLWGVNSGWHTPSIEQSSQQNQAPALSSPSS